MSNSKVVEKIHDMVMEKPRQDEKPSTIRVAPFVYEILEEEMRELSRLGAPTENYEDLHVAGTCIKEDEDMSALEIVA